MKKTAPVILLLLLSLLLSSLVGCSSSDSDTYYAIDHFRINEEGDAFRASFDALTKATYDWYQSIEGEDGVYIIHYDHYSKDLLTQWKENGVKEHIPAGDLDYYVASMNYLEDHGMTFSPEDKQQIQDGVRLYLLPDTLEAEELEALKLYLSEDALYGLDQEPLIDTAFRQDKKIEFLLYHPQIPLEIPGGGEITDPVIYVASCNNMKYFEAESLIATGLSDAYICLTQDAYLKYAKDALPQELKEKEVTFLGLSKLSK